MNKNTDILIIGAGASGLMAAVSVAEKCPELSVTVLESLDSPLKKLSVTGNGRCNFTHQSICGNEYYSDDSEKVLRLLKVYSSERIVDYFSELGVVSVNKEGYYYPLSFSASAFCSVLLQRAAELGICIVTGVVNARLKREKLFSASFSDKQSNKINTVTASAVILATGSRAGGFTKADPLSPAWDLGLSYKKPLPALTRVFCDNPLLEKINGIRCNGSVSLYSGTDCVMSESGEIQFVKEGLSGIAVFQLSGRVSRLAEEGARDLSIHMNFLPDYSKEHIVKYLTALQKRYPDRCAAGILTGLFRNDLAIALLEVHSVNPSNPMNERQIKCLTDSLTDYTFSVIGTDSIKNAQVCTGGLFLSDFDDDFQCKTIPGLFACGEVLNADGPCGGYNLHFAWSSGIIAGTGAANYVKSGSNSL